MSDLRGICYLSCFLSRRNCKGNPNCLVNLGEKEWLKEIRDEHWYQMDDPEEEKRTKVSDYKAIELCF